MDNAIEKKIIQLYVAYKYSLRRISEVTNYSHETIRQVLIKHKKIRKKKMVNVDHNKVIKHFNKSQSYQATATHFDISRSYVFEIVNGRRYTLTEQKSRKKTRKRPRR